MSSPTPLVRLFANIVTAVSAKVLSTIQAAELAQYRAAFADATESNIVQINYQFGHFKEIIETMKEYELDPAHQMKKYPMIALLMDFPESRGNNGGYFSEVTLQIIIAYVTEPGLKAAERYTKNFEPILLPIYYELLNQIDQSGYFVSLGVDNIRHTKIDHPYYGKGGLSDTSGNVFADTIDAIEIQNLQLKTQIPNCS